MKHEKSCGALVYRKHGDRTELLLIKHRFGGHWSFPKGHVELGENEFQTALREVKEETGLDVKDFEACGMINWCKSDGSGRYLEFLYKTSVFSGQLSEGTDEGNIFWLPKSELYTRPLSPNFAEYLPVFFSDKYVEALGEWTIDDSFTGIKYFS